MNWNVFEWNYIWFLSAELLFLLSGFHLIWLLILNGLYVVHFINCDLELLDGFVDGLGVVLDHVLHLIAVQFWFGWFLQQTLVVEKKVWGWFEVPFRFKWLYWLSLWCKLCKLIYIWSMVWFCILRSRIGYFTLDVDIRIVWRNLRVPAALSEVWMVVLLFQPLFISSVNLIWWSWLELW